MKCFVPKFYEASASFRKKKRPLFPPYFHFRYNIKYLYYVIYRYCCAGRTDGRAWCSVAGGKSVVRTEADHHVPRTAAASRDRNEIWRPSVWARRRVCRTDAVARPRVLRIIRERVQERLQRVITREFRGTFGILIGFNNLELALPCTYVLYISCMCIRVQYKTKAGKLNFCYTGSTKLVGLHLFIRARDGFPHPYPPLNIYLFLVVTVFTVYSINYF